MNFFEILYAKKNGAALPANFFDLLFAKSFTPAVEWGEYDGTLPAQFNANGDDLSQYQVYGNTGDVGDRTVNLWKRDLTKDGYYGESGSFISNKGYVSSKAVDIIGVSIITQIIRSLYTSGFYNQFAYFDENFNFISIYRQTQSGTGIKTISNTPPNNAKYLISSIIANSTDIMLVLGSTAPAEFVPFGYQLPIVVRSANKFDYTRLVDGYTYDSNGQMVLNPDEASRWNYAAIPPIPVIPGATYLRTYNLTPIGNVVNYYDINGNLIEQATPGTGVPFTVPNNCYFISYVINIKNDRNKYMLTEGSTVPEKYQPYSNNTTPIYIGDTALEEDEYVDYKEQKIYRMVNGVLTPTDPPVALPALPTVDGTTIVDYAGQSTPPSRFYAKYQKG